jgi:hypothetical protein
LRCNISNHLIVNCADHDELQTHPKKAVTSRTFWPCWKDFPHTGPFPTFSQKIKKIEMVPCVIHKDHAMGQAIEKQCLTKQQPYNSGRIPEYHVPQTPKTANPAYPSGICPKSLIFTEHSCHNEVL